MNGQLSSTDFTNLLQDIEETIIVWQKQMKEKMRDRRFNARQYLAEQLGYKDPKVIYKLLDINDISKYKFGIEDLERIIRITKDITPLRNYVDALEEELR